MDSGRSSKMTPSWKWSITLAKLGVLVTLLKLSPFGPFKDSPIQKSLLK